MAQEGDRPPTIGEKLNNPEFVGKLREADPGAFRLQYYLISGDEIVPDEECNARDCLMKVQYPTLWRADGKGEVQKVKMKDGVTVTGHLVEFFSFCYCCNKVSHAKCENIDVGLVSKEHTEMQLPNRCSDCMNNPTNTKAIMFARTEESRLSTFDRANLFRQEDHQLVSLPRANVTLELFAMVDKMETSTVKHHLIKTVSKRRASRQLLKTKASIGSRTELKRVSQIVFSDYSDSEEELEKSESNETQQQYNSTPNAASGARSLKRTTYLTDISVADLGTQDKILLEQTEIQRQTNEQQLLVTRRRALKAIPKFDGTASKYIEFLRCFERYRDIGRYDEETLKQYVFSALEGDAYNVISPLVDHYSVHEVMAKLEKLYGKPVALINSTKKPLANLSFSDPYKLIELRHAITAIDNYYRTCTFVRKMPLEEEELGRQLLLKLSCQQRYQFKEKYPTDESKLKDFQEYFEKVYDLVSTIEVEDEKPRSRQVHSINVRPSNADPSAITRGSFDMYAVRGKGSQDFGYNMEKVDKLVAKCEFCNGSHFSVQCQKYRAMSIDRKFEAVQDKNLCRCCLLVKTHQSRQCDLRNGCGYKENNEICGYYHHPTLHLAYQRYNAQTKHNFRFGGRGNGRDRGSRKTYFNNRSNNSHYSTNNVNHQQPSDKQRDIPQKSSCNDAGEDKIKEAVPAHPDISKAGNQKFTSPRLEQLKNLAQTKVAATCPISILSIEDSEQTFEDHTAENNTHEESSVQQTLAAFNENRSESEPFIAAPLSNNMDGRSVKLFKTAFIGVDREIVRYAVGDSAAEVTLMSESLRKELKIDGVPRKLITAFANGSTATIEATKISLQIRGVHDGAELLTLHNVYAIPNLNLPARTMDVESLKKKYPHLRKVHYDSYQDASPDLLIGTPHASIFESRRLFEGAMNQPIGIKAKLGYSIYGGASISHAVENDVLSIECVKEEDEEFSNEKLTELWCYINSIDSLGIRDNKVQRTPDERSAIALIDAEMRARSDGTIEVPLIWKLKDGEIPPLGNNYYMVLKRQQALELKLKKNQAYLDAFNNNFKELIRQGYVRPATQEDLQTTGNLSFIPMSLVVNENKVPVKYRIVFDASAKYKGESLNTHLLKGPDLLINQIGPLLRMRMDNVAFTADVKSMFHRIRICDRDSLCQCVLWRSPDDGIMRMYVVTAMLFGPSCSPFVSQYVKNFIARQWAPVYPEAAKSVEEDVYMDDQATSCQDDEKASLLCKQSITIFDSMNMELRNVQSNSKSFLATLPVECVSKESLQMLENDNVPCVIKVLGCLWNNVADCYQFQFDANVYLQLVQSCDHRPTKRNQCSTIARIYDIYGFITPFIIQGKIILQMSWQNGINWDTEVDDESYDKWTRWVKQIANVAKIQIPRQFRKHVNLSEVGVAELHTFTDAGSEAFAAVCYVVITTADGTRTSIIAMSRAKVTPLRLKTKTKLPEIPRLELYSCHMGARLANTITTELPRIKFKQFFWSDSKVALTWIKKPEHRLMKYAVTPIEEILEKSSREEWRYVPSKLNAADLATKMMPLENVFSDSNSTWFHGPDFLMQAEDNWPSQTLLVQDMEARVQEEQEEEAQKNVAYATLTVSLQEMYDNNHFPKYILPMHSQIATDDCIERLSASTFFRYNKLIRAVARALKIYFAFVLFSAKQILIKLSNKGKQIKIPVDLVKIPNNLQDETFRQWKVSMNELSPDDLYRALMFVARREQKIHYKEDYSRLLKNLPPVNENLRQLHVWLDKQQVMRIDSRVQLEAEYQQAFLPVLPRKSSLALMLMEQIHHDYRHTLLDAQAVYVRSIFWIPQLSTALRSVKQHCNFCRFIAASPNAPIMAPLPFERIAPEYPPFSFTSLDCFGPIVVNQKRRASKKMRVVLFTCMRTRFIHLHLLEDLSTESMLEAITLFYPAHGPVRAFLSDNGTNFVGTAKKLKEDQDVILNAMKNAEFNLKPNLSRMMCDWNFLPPHSPWMGGVHERVIAELKRATKTTLNDKHITKQSLNIALHEAAHRINNRPLTHVPLEADDAPALTPHMLAKNRSGFPFLRPFPPEEYQSTLYHDRSYYNAGQKLAHEITRRFVQYYLPVLTRRTKWTQNCNSPIKVDDLVLLIEPNDTRMDWQRARVIRIYKGKDGHGRVADVIMPNGKVKKSRAIQRLAKLDLQSSVLSNNQSDEKI